MILRRLFAGEEGPEHRNQNQGDNEANDYQAGTCFYIVHEFETGRDQLGHQRADQELQKSA